jgi:hypothetical protein
MSKKDLVKSVLGGIMAGLIISALLYLSTIYYITIP